MRFGEGPVGILMNGGMIRASAIVDECEQPVRRLEEVEMTEYNQGNGRSRIRKDYSSSDNDNSGGIEESVLNLTIDFEDNERMPSTSDLVMVRLFSFQAMVAMTIIFTTTEEYAKRVGLDKGVYSGLLIGLVPLVSGFCTFLWQVCLRKSGFKVSFIGACFIGMIGSIMYAISGHYNSAAMMFCSRILVGIATPTNLYIEYHAIALGNNVRTPAITTIWAVSTLGLGFGPLLSALINQLELVGLGPEAPIIFNSLSAPGWVMGVFNLGLLIMYAVMFRGPTLNDQLCFHNLRRANTEKGINRQPEVSVATTILLAALLMSQFSASLGVSAVETRAAFVALAKASVNQANTLAWSWTVTAAGLYLAGFFTFFAIASYVVGTYTKRTQIKDRTWVIGSTSIVILSCALLFDYGARTIGGEVAVWSFGFAFFGCAMVILRSVSTSLSLKLCPNHLVGSYSSFIALVSSVGRALGAVWATYIGDGYQNQSTFALLLLITFVCNLALLVLFYKKLIF
mmetsp:Transcript_11284/g.18431  ORF Transcript_11284/g.18431 Transcript_11284/m.18431 type:complete len:512 (-) Transcript_11284:1324-2859(-)|eukprot:CAMPEP_0203778300 /NCGR_PEP_ID=MMETSP0099_2-20121227/7915_1 /ASSEMBLY_ACC=CAM_ASM_000209 /TAXON_ID=96639 /ORGANISM=" , Strain NY0313808BC1" /LENGTH=511 /DNA_ID=CAMNT_0050677783 /DNA_START=568 /DNA_END=2103 /DNA_ORIENTATION=+